MTTRQFDLDRYLADREERVQRVEEARRVADEAQAELDQFDAGMDLVRRYLADGEGSSINVPGGVLDGLPASAALAAYTAENPGQIVKVKATFEALQNMGFDGTLNSIQVAFAVAHKAGQIERVTKGRYRLAPPEQTTFAGELAAAPGA